MRYRTRQKLDWYAFGGALAVIAFGFWWLVRS